MLMVTGLVPGLSAELSSVVQAGDLVLAIDGFGCLSMDLQGYGQRQRKGSGREGKGEGRS